MRNLVAVITKKKGDKLGHGQDTILTVYDMTVSYTMMIAKALSQLDGVEVELEGVSEEDLIQAKQEQRVSWAKAVASSADGGVAWASRTEYQGLRAIQHNGNGNVYVQGYAVMSKTIEYDANRPAPKKTRGSRNGVTAAKKELRKLADGWRMSAVSEGTMIYTGETAEALYNAAQG